MVMIMVNIYEAKVAELRAIEAVSTAPRDLTPMYAGATFTPAAFFEPLAPDEIATWEDAEGEVPKAAEARAAFPSRPDRRRKSKARK